MKFWIPNIYLLLTVGISYAANGPIGFGKDTTGGKGGIVYHVKSYKELITALDNNKKNNDPKIIYIDSSINGLEDENGKILTTQDFSKGFNFQKYVDCFSKDGKIWSNTTECNEIENLRKKGFENQKAKIMVTVTPNTTIIGNGINAKLEEISLQITKSSNVIVRNLYIQAPTDLFPEWDPSDNEGNWNSEYDAIVISGSTNVWVDNCYLTDGDKTEDTYPVIFKKHIEAHDGLIDIVNGSDFVTISNNRFEDHQKTILIGNSDSAEKQKIDTGHLRVTFYNNVFVNCGERLPRVRFGRVHVFNNYYLFDISNKHLYEAQYFIGLGLECNILSEYNSFNHVDNKKYVKNTIIKNFNGKIFHDIGSEYNGNKVNLDEIAQQESENIKISSDAFEPNEFYDYKVNKDLNYVNDLINHVPSWMFESNENPKPNTTNTVKIPKTVTTSIQKITISSTTKTKIPKPTNVYEPANNSGPNNNSEPSDYSGSNNISEATDISEPVIIPETSIITETNEEAESIDSQESNNNIDIITYDEENQNEVIPNYKPTTNLSTSNANSIIKMSNENLLIILITIVLIINNF